ncbi:MAG: class II fructose-bisphosphate aldolase [Ornithinimicrobium sp.]|uniref:class II fructose-bisphosphate aldolase n=1 Tax=Ornithinimicrobium sp. TaxID=1977084 RepID=UPI003D9BA44C
MSLSPLSAVLEDAASAGRGLAAFNVILLEHAEAYAAAAEQTGRPVVMQLSQNCVRYHGSLRPLALATLAVAEQCDQSVVVHLDHADDLDLIREAVGLGVSSVMYDGSALPDAQNREQTREVVRLCRAEGVDVEAELGEVGGKDGVHAPGARTDPGDAVQFVADTGVQALAVAVGTSHAMTDRTAVLDDGLIQRLRSSVPVPLVLHGSSGVSDAGLVAAVRAGMSKINIATHLNRAFTEGLATSQQQRPSSDPRRFVGAGRAAVTAEAARLLELLADI